MKRPAPLVLAGLLGSLIGAAIVWGFAGPAILAGAGTGSVAAPATQAPPTSVQAVGPAPAGALLSDAGWPRNAPTPEQVVYSQHELLARELARLEPRTAGKVNLYAVVFAGDGSQDVFWNESEYFDKLFTRRLGAKGHVIVLENNPASLATRPLATWTNLENALDGIAAKMDPTRDVLLLYFTTHGSEDHTLLVDMDPLPLDQIGASDLPGILAEHPFKYKVVIVNACYSGGFIPPLAGPGTMIITAARSDRSSFGCGEQSELTWFGHAFLVDALNRTDDFQRAFQLARAEVAQWEKRDRYEPSEPQISVGSGIAAQLAAWRKGFAPGPAVPFAPAPTPAASAATGAAP
jgi:hypothetical protein